MTQTTRLSAVNTCLEAIGEAPVNAIPTSGVSEASVALNTIERISREVQGKALTCNSEKDYPLALNDRGEIILPRDFLFVDPTDPRKDYVVRGRRLYDKGKHTFTFTESVKVDITFHLEFEDLPEHVKHYVAIRAARVFQRNWLGSTNLNAISMEDEQHALVNFTRGEKLVDDRSMLQGAQAQAILRRG